MEPTTVALFLIASIAFLILLVHKALAPIVPVKGTTNVPGPTTGIRWPIIGDALRFAGVKDTKGMWDAVQKLGQMREDIISLYLGSKLVLVITSPDILDKLVKSNKCNMKEVEFYSSFQFLSDGVFSTANIERWSQMRPQLDRTLHPKKMADTMLVIVDKAKMACDKIQSKCERGVFDVIDIMQYYTMDITLEVFLGQPGNLQVDDPMNIPDLLSRLVSEVQTTQKMNWAISCVLLRMINPLFKTEWIFRLSSLGKELLSVKDELRPYLKQMVKNSLKEMNDRGVDPNEPSFEPENYLETIIHVGLREKSSEETLIFSFIDLIVAGYDTTAVAISTAILYLAMHPEYQETAYREQKNILGNSLDPPTRSELSSMVYLDMAFNETLRKVSVPAIVRVLNGELEIDNYVMPEGASLYIMYHLMAKNKKYWERPDSYYPDHFLPENVAKRPKCAYMPFSFGSRSCPGKMLGHISGKLILSMLLRRFRFTTKLQYKDITYKYMIMLQCEQGYPVEAIPRLKAPSF